MSLQNDDNFRHDTEEYVSNLKAGMHDPGWLQDAWAAHEARAAGEFDEYYIRQLEVDWRSTIPDDMKPAHLRSVPPTEPKRDTESESQAEQPSTADQPANDTGSSNEAKAEIVQPPAVAEERNIVVKVGGSEAVENDTKDNNDDGIQDVIVAPSTEASTDSVTEDLEKISVANTHETMEENPARTTTSPGAD
jgi:hypothetical protein